MNDMRLLLVSALSVIHFLSHGMECISTQRAKKLANTRLLHAAAMGNSEAVINLLVEGIADINTHNRGQYTPLHLACLNNHTDTAFTLLKAGADVDMVNRDGETALVYAVKNKNSMLVNALVSSQADINIWDQSGISLLSLALESGQSETVKRLLDNGSTQKEGTLLLATVKYNTPCCCYQCNEKNCMYLDTIKLLIQSGVEVDIQTMNYWHTPLILACFENNTDASFALIEAGADVNIANRYGQTAFMGAVGNRNIDVMYALIKAGADVNVYDVFGINALELAINSQQFEMSMVVLNPVLKLYRRKKIETLLMIYKSGFSELSLLPQEILQLIVTFMHPEFAMDCQLLSEIDPLVLIDTIPLEVLSLLIHNNMLHQDDIISAWHEKIVFLVQALEAQRLLSNEAIQQFETDVLVHIIMTLMC